MPVEQDDALPKVSCCGAATKSHMARWASPARPACNKETRVRKLGQTIASMARYRRHWSTLLQSTGAHRAAAEPGASSDHLTELTGFGSNPGALRMFTFAPKDLGPSPALVVVLHGCTQSAGSYDLGAGWSTLAQRHGFVLLLPEQTPASNPKTCFNWFLPSDTARDQGEALSIRQMIEKTIGAHDIDRGRVFITGLSAGGAMAAAMLASYPDVFSAGGIIAGLPYGSAGNVQQAFESMFQGRPRSAPEWGDLVRRASAHRGPWPRVSVWHGDADATVVPMNAEGLVRQWTDVHGIAAAPVEDRINGYARKVWRRDGVDVVESYTIAGMAHGTPLATGAAEEACGKAGPFLLEAGISSSYRIAKFFGLTGAARASAPARKAAEVERTPLAPDDQVEIIPDERVEILGKDGDRFEDARGPMNVMAIITKALTSAGLMKPPA
jgi:poly(hydroxyalkanoate) depolymerase family esterase